jgi:hypothetical protein
VGGPSLSRIAGSVRCEDVAGQVLWAFGVRRTWHFQLFIDPSSPSPRRRAGVVVDEPKDDSGAYAFAAVNEARQCVRERL